MNYPLLGVLRLEMRPISTYLLLLLVVIKDYEGAFDAVTLIQIP